MTETTPPKGACPLQQKGPAPFKRGQAPFGAGLFWGALLLFAVITGLMVSHRAVKGSNDFDTFYEAGRAVLEGRGIYYAGEYYQDQGKISPFLYPPAAACFFALWAWMPIRAAAFLWNLFNLGLLFGIVPLTLKLLQSSRKEFRDAWRGVPKLLQAILAAWTTAALLDHLTMAQMNLWVFFLTLAAFAAWQAKASFRAGLLLSAAVMMKVTPLLFLPYFLIKKQGRVLAGFFSGALLLTLLLPTLGFGLENNRLYHRQFLGRTLKPALIRILAHFKQEPEHPLKKSAEDFAYARLTNCLTDKNQSLEASLTRLLLKDRGRYEKTPYELASVRKYRHLPTLFGGLSEGPLFLLIRLIQLAFFGTLLALWVRPGGPDGTALPKTALDLAAGFLTLTLLSPALRSQQYVVWFFALAFLVILHRPGLGIQPGLLRRAGIFTAISCLLYFGQASLYGRAAGAGTWANLILWIALANLWHPITMFGREKQPLSPPNAKMPDRGGVG